jgi:hypothetical protein
MLHWLPCWHAPGLMLSSLYMDVQQADRLHDAGYHARGPWMFCTWRSELGTKAHTALVGFTQHDSMPDGLAVRRNCGWLLKLPWEVWTHHC